MTNPDLPVPASEITPAVETLSHQLARYLGQAGLPAEQVLVHMNERRVVMRNVPEIILRVTDEQKAAGMYISKFVAACAAGLFDAALNYLWNETVRNLRGRVARFDISYFYDSVVTDAPRRSKFRVEDDLSNLDDWDLIRGCRMTGLITDLGFRHLDYIRDMRNHASAAHPNQNDLTGLQLSSWLETCILEVLSKEPVGPVVEVGRLLANVRTQTLSAGDVGPIASSLLNLPDELASSLLRAVLGMYSDLDISTQVRDNVRLIAPSIWGICPEAAKFDAGLKLASLEANGEVDRAKRVREFLELVEGLSYLPKDRLALEVSTAVDALMFTHNGMNNFYNEPAPATLLARLIPESGDVPNEVAVKYVKALTLCRIGNGFGISWAAATTYDKLISKFSDRQIYYFVTNLRDPEVASRLQFSSCASNLRQLATALHDQVVNAGLREVLAYVTEGNDRALAGLATDRKLMGMFKNIR